MDGNNGDDKDNTSLVLKAGDTCTLTFREAIKVTNNGKGMSSSMSITVIIGNLYTLHVTVEGSQTLDVTAVQGL